MNCPNCHQAVANGAAFCGACGARLASAAPSPEPDPMRPTPALATAGTGGAGSGAGSTPFSAEATASFVARVKAILLSPKTEWPVIAGENTAPMALFTGYVIPLAVLAALVNFLRMSVVGISMPFGGTYRIPLLAGLTNAVFTCVMAAVGVGIIAFIINLLAGTFGGTSNGRRALQTAAYSVTAAYVGTVLGLLPMGTLLSLLAGLYGIYTLYLGLPVMMQSKPDKAVGYTASVVICTIVLGLILGALSATLGIGFGRASGLGAFHHSSDSEVAREQAAATVGNAIGSMLGTDEKGKQGIGAAISNLAKAGEQMQQQERQRAMSSADSAGSTATASSGTGSADAAGSAQPNPAAAVGGLMAALGGSLGGAHRHAPVDFHQLEAVLPASMAGMDRQQASGAANQALGIKKTSATGTYRGAGDARAEVNITDAAGVAGLMDVAASMNVSETSESDSGFEKDVSLNGRKVHEKYDRNSHHGEISAIVARRFTVDISGYGLSMEDLERSLAAIDLNALESMKDAGATSE